ncbi:MAG: serine/threonine protein kinase [Planctomycetes bacterium]|nr:serine/threonine protein kinase [Planctomycetota bacterium]
MEFTDKQRIQTSMLSVSVIDEALERGEEVPFGDYAIISKISRGGTSRVFKARHNALRRDVALKILIPSQQDEDEEIVRFYKEAESIARLRHPNIVTVHHVGIYGGLHYITMDYIPGSAMSELLEIAPFPVRRALQLIRPIASALGYAHARKIIHRDVKPGNIILANETRPMLMDFGLAKQVDADDNITKTGIAMGTPPYMSPEQARGEMQTLGERSDIYSLGATLYEMLTGRTPFVDTASVKLLYRAIEEMPEPPSKWNPQIPHALDTIVLHCLEKRPEDRYQTTAEFARDVSLFLDDEQFVSVKISPRSKVWRRILSFDSIAAVSIAGILFLVFVVAIVGREANLDDPIFWVESDDLPLPKIEDFAPVEGLEKSESGAIYLNPAESGFRVYRLARTIQGECRLTYSGGLHPAAVAGRIEPTADGALFGIGISSGERRDFGIESRETSDSRFYPEATSNGGLAVLFGAEENTCVRVERDGIVVTRIPFELPAISESGASVWIDFLLRRHTLSVNAKIGDAKVSFEIPDVYGPRGGYDSLAYIAYENTRLSVARISVAAPGLPDGISRLALVQNQLDLAFRAGDDSFLFSYVAELAGKFEPEFEPDSENRFEARLIQAVSLTLTSGIVANSPEFFESPDVFRRIVSIESEEERTEAERIPADEWIALIERADSIVRDLLSERRAGKEANRARLVQLEILERKLRMNLNLVQRISGADNEVEFFDPLILRSRELIDQILTTLGEILGADPTDDFRRVVMTHLEYFCGDLAARIERTEPGQARILTFLRESFTLVVDGLLIRTHQSDQPFKARLLYSAGRECEAYADRLRPLLANAGANDPALADDLSRNLERAIASYLDISQFHKSVPNVYRAGFSRLIACYNRLGRFDEKVDVIEEALKPGDATEAVLNVLFTREAAEGEGSQVTFAQANSTVEEIDAQVAVALAGRSFDGPLLLQLIDYRLANAVTEEDLVRVLALLCVHRFASPLEDAWKRATFAALAGERTSPEVRLLAERLITAEVEGGEDEDASRLIESVAGLQTVLLSELPSEDLVEWQRKFESLAMSVPSEMRIAPVLILARIFEVPRDELPRVEVEGESFLCLADDVLKSSQ